MGREGRGGQERWAGLKEKADNTSRAFRHTGNPLLGTSSKSYHPKHQRKSTETQAGCLTSQKRAWRHTVQSVLSFRRMARRVPSDSAQSYR